MGFNTSYLSTFKTSLSFLALIISMVVSAAVYAGTAATITTQIGDTVTNPSTNVDVQVLQIITDGSGDTIYAIADDGSVILTKTAIGDTIEQADGTYKVITNNVNATSGLIDIVNIQIQGVQNPPAPVAQNVATDSGADFGVPPGSEATPGAPEVDPPALTSGVIYQVKIGGSGGNGKDGYGVEICDPTGVLGCATIGYKGTDGGDGKKPSDLVRNIPSSYNGGAPITSTANSKPGMTFGSVGGKGGQGGDAYGNISARAGGDGGAGGNVYVTNGADVNVSGTNSYGMYLFSRSGNAGKGGSGWIFSGGGSGGSARAGGRVEGTNNAQITTSGDGGHAIRGFSSGGGAGSGGGSWGIIGTAGNGARGGNGGAVVIRNNGPLVTNGNNAHGILVQSIGGSGGDAGAAGGLYASGGSGSTGGNGSTATVINTGSITTTGDDARGIMAQSIGGGGGSGGGSGGLVALSGSGGAAGNGSTVSVTNSGNITTFGKRSDAIYAQSIGGGGGSGGGAGGAVATGSSGGGAGRGGAVRVNNSGTLITLDDYSRGIFAQSIGGGGGSGGGSGGLVALSGNGGGAGNGSSITIGNSGAITTGVFDATGVTSSGRDSDAIFAQSIGGGGGDGAGAGGLVASGGSGGGSGNGGVVTITNSGALTTLYDDSSGIFVQSIGGGGGAGAGSGGLVALGGAGGGSGNGNTVSVTNNLGGDIATFGASSTAIFAQSVGGGGGAGAGSGGFVAVSGKGGGSGTGGAVTVNNAAAISTVGTESRGLHAQSIGGGGGAGGGAGGLVALGGSGGGASRGGVVSVNNRGDIRTGFFGGSGIQSDAIFAQSIGGGGGSGAGSGGIVGVSGSGGGAGAGGRVSVSNSGLIETYYTSSFGIFAQSVGGGGGSGGGAGGLVALGGSGGGAASAARVTVTNQTGASIVTYGERSGAIFAQSVGGGGGNGAGSGGIVALSGSGGGSGNGGEIIVSNNARLSTIGDQSRGILAQSIGGGGGSGSGAGGLVALSGGGGGSGNGARVTVTNTGDISTGKEGVAGKTESDAIFAQSIGGGGGSGAGSGGLVALSGSGGGGGSGAQVSVANDGNLSTWFDNSNGIFAQSLGGGGGSGLGSGGLVALGGGGSGGGNGSNVTVGNTGNISTRGDFSRGIFAQSLGGGGGSGGDTGALVALGGGGSAGGASGIVRVTNSGDIATRGEFSQGIFAQSIAGGGGSGGNSGGLVAVGGSSTSSGDSKEVTVTNNGNITTLGPKSDGILVQSIGGGGGNAGSAGGPISIGGSASSAGGSNSGVVTVNNTTAIQTFGEDSRGIFAQSVGGGGGNGGSAYSGSLFIGVGVGGAGGAGGEGGAVNINLDRTPAVNAVTTESFIYTRRDRSTGILAQSVGGSGGNGGDAYAVSAGIYGSVSVAIGGNGGGGGEGGDVSLTGSSRVLTEGDISTGILLQSVGGGGGNGGMSVAAAAAGGDVASVAASVSLGGNGGGGNDAGSVTVEEANLMIETRGDQSSGLIAQSVGGGGGNGGVSIAGTVAASGGASGAVSVGLGGSGASGGAGGDVDVDFSGSIKTAGALSDGALIQSIGGGGGNGGMTIAASLAGGTGAGTVGVGLGGNAGGAGHAGKVNVDVSAAIDTNGDGADGLVVQAIGGGGGSGGLSVTGGLAGGAAGAGSISVGIGGNGAGGGNANEVIANYIGDLITRGLNSTGILVQSVGGGGGNGGGSIAASLAGAGAGAGAVNVGLGGTGGGGGLGGAAGVERAVSLQTRGSVVTLQDNSAGIIAQSVGGGGGVGGFNVTAGIAGAGTGAGSVSVGIGGSGGGAGDGKKVETDIRSSVATYGNDSTAVTVQSIGGGGGSGGMTVSVATAGAGVGSGAISVGVGGSGGTGGKGGEVDTQMTADIFTRGNNSNGLLVQSVGGGGGNGGLTVSASGTIAGTGSGAAAVGVGGSGGDGGLSSYVSSLLRGSVFTEGKNSSAVIAQSIGGGGGNGALSIAGTLAGAGTGTGGAAVGVGGSGGKASDGGEVSNTIVGDISTLEAGSGGVLVQSVGGGGGNGGVSVAGAVAMAGTGSGAASVGVGGSGGGGGSANKVTNRITGDITTRSEDAAAVIAQSVGGGGGNGGLSVAGGISLSGNGSGAASVGIGGSGGSGGDADRVSNTVTGDVSTWGENSDAIIAQSIGGGGGNGGINVSTALNISRGGGGAVGIGVGGSGGGAGDGGTVFNEVVGQIYTDMKESIGVLAQSVGGGGGNGGLNVTATIAASVSGASGSIGVGVGGMGGNGGSAQTVTNNVTGSVVTRGDNSTAILSQSLGGGGGNGALNVTGAVNLALQGQGGALGVGVGGFGGGGGDAGDVFSTVVANGQNPIISTSGDNSMGVVAQSIAGGGGNGGLNVTGALSFANGAGGAIGIGVGGFGGGGGDSGNVDLNVTGDVQTVGSNSTAILAQSLAGGGGNGGLNVSGSISISSTKDSANASIGIGGFGGDGGNAGDVSVAYEGAVNSPWTNGIPDSTATGSNGILAQSLGGGGGNGALNISGGLSYSSTQAGNALVVGIGGFGGGGGTAGAVDLTVTGGNSITALGDQASAIFAQSLGGGGGNGGINISGGFTSSSPVVFGVGGFGGAGGTADSVVASVESDLYANGINSTGITAQSLGGGGGNGALSIAGGGSFNAKKSSSSFVFGVGGFGGAAAVSANTTVTQKGSITTVGDGGHGILAQSLAGGGGNGGLNVAVGINGTNDPSKNSQDFSVVGGIGGFGGEGADAGDVVVVSSGNITTKGEGARGIFAQSVGGGGGTGGMNVTSNIAKNSSPITMGIGGFGSGGGDAGAVSVSRGSVSQSAGLISTDGVASHGIEASSIGGGGGDAGMNFSFSYTSAGNGTNGKKDKKSERSVPKNTGVDDSVIGNYNAVLDELEGRQSGGEDTTGKKAYAAQLMIGGSGGESGDGGAVTVYNFGDIETTQNMSNGVFAQSIGGGGGNASFNIAYTKANNVDKSVNLALGGATGDGGVGGVVYAEHLGKIITRGSNSVGVFAQSVGGGGGNTGMDMVSSSASQGNVALTMGRRGGTGGQGGAVTVVSGGEIETYGLNSYGIQAQSVGNGGGNSSSSSVSGPLPSTSSGTSRKAALSVGLEGGVGGYAGDVDVTASGKITTRGELAHGIFAQSVGGGGGNGGDASLGSIVDFFLPATEGQSYGLAVGGKGGIGGYGGKVDVDSSAVISTFGKGAMGILAQSVGGGGGSGGKSTRFGKLKNNGNVSVNVGGSGGTGATGGDVAVGNTGLIVTRGQAAHGILAQTIGGGGGQAGMVLSAVYSKAEDSGSNLSVQVGGGGGDASSFSGDVIVNNSGGIETFAARSVGIFGQSVGGGGGNANLVVGLTAAQGSEGAGQKDFSLAIGGAGGTGGTGGDVTINNTDDGSLYSGLIVTHGDASHGIAAMSIGGGGGQGSTVVSLERSKTEGSSRTLGIGGVGGEGGTSGLVKVTNEGTIVTFGEKAHGILAQSIGGGGGNAGDVLIINSRPKGSTAQGIAIGGSGGDGNVSGDVEVYNSGAITTYGESSYGILAQSIGGGGGNGAIAISNPKNAVTSLATAKAFNSLAMGGVGGTGADSGDVLVSHSGNITIEGDNSYGIYAQSVSGGGGSIGASLGNPLTSLAATGLQLAIGALQTQGEAGTVSVVVSGDIVVSGRNSSAIFQQSVNGGGGEVEVFMDLTDSAAALSENSVNIEDNLSIQEQIDNSVTDFVLDIGGQEVVDAAGEAVDFVQQGKVLAFGDSSTGNSVQSVGGGGGDSYINLNYYEGQQVDVASSLGSQQTRNSSGGDINGNRQGLVGVVGSGGAGTSVQSIGGGGGVSALVFDANSIPSANSASVSPAVTPLTGIVDLVLQLGATGGDSNSGGLVAITSTGDAITQGDRTMAIILQSIGGGGGQQFLSGADRVDTTLGGVDGAQGDGQAITLDNIGLVQTDGELAHGIVLQSIGGGGGLLLSDTAREAVTVTLSSDNAGNGGRVELNQIGDINVFGARSYGVLAQSIGGGGGAVDDVFLGSSGGVGRADDVIISLLGSAVTYGDHGVGLFGQSAGELGAGDVLFGVRGNIGAAGDFSTGLIGLSQSPLEAGRVGITLEGNAFASGRSAVGLELALAGFDSTEAIDLSAWGLSASGANSIALRGSTTARNAGALSIQLRDSVTASGAAATGIDYRSFGEDSSGSIGVNIGNSIVAGGSSSLGLLASTRSSGVAAGIGVSLGGSTIASGSGATGMALLVNGGTAAGGIGVRVGGGITASGSGAAGVRASISGSGSSGISTRVGGSVSALGANSTGVSLSSGGNHSVGVSGSVVAAGLGATGISSRGAATQLRVGGSVIADAQDATGIRSNSAGEGVQMRVAGDVVARGERANGANLKVTSGSVSSRIDGNIMASGSEATGLFSSAISNGTTLDLGGDISVEGDRAAGARLLSGRGSITAGIGGSLVAMGSNVVGLSGVSDTGGRLKATIDGSVGVEGLGGRGIELHTSGQRSSGAVTVSTAESVSAFAGATALHLRSSSEGLGGRLDVDVNGDAEALGANSVALDMQSSGVLRSGELRADVAGKLLVEGVGASGVLARSIGTANAADVSFVLAGLARSTGEGSTGVNLLTQAGTGGQVSGRFGASVGVLGDNGIAVMAASRGGEAAGSVFLSMADSVFAEGEGATAVRMESIADGASGDLTFQTLGDLQSFGTGSRGLQALGQAGETAGSIFADITGSTVVNGDRATGIELSLNAGQAVGSIETNVGGDLLVLGSAARGIDVAVQTGAVDGSSGRTRRTALDVQAQPQTSEAGVDVSVAGSTLAEGDGVIAITLQNTALDTAGNINVIIGGDAFTAGDAGRVVDIQSLAQNRAGDLNLQITGDTGIEGVEGTGIVMTSRGDKQAGDVALALAGDVIATGGASLAVHASSISSSGNSGAVDAVIGGSVTVDGDGARGIVLESLGSQSAGPVTLDVAGSVMAMGDGGVAISASSRGRSGGDIQITTAVDEYIFAGSNGTAVLLNGSKASKNTLLLNGPTMTEDGLFGTAVVGTTGSDTVTNQQMYVGQFNLGGGSNKFVNNGMFVAGPRQSLGAAEGTLVNNAELLIGDYGNAQSLTLAGSFVQTADAVTFTEIDFASDKIDQVLATGTADLDGEVTLTLLSPELIRAGEFSRVLFGAEQGVTDNGLQLNAVSTLVAQYSLDFSSENAAELVYTVDFSPKWLAKNVRSGGEYINRVQNAGSSRALADEVVTLLLEDDEVDYQNALSSILPDFYGEQQVQLIRASQSFATRMLSCKQTGGNYRFTSEGNCAWVNAGYENLEHDNYLGANFESEQISMGAQVSFSDHWFAGIGGSYEKIDGDGNSDAWKSNGETTQFGASLKYQPNAWKFSSVLSYGRNDSDTVRQGQIVEAFTTQAGRKIDSLGLLFSGSYDFEYAAGYIRPGLELGFNRIDARDATESGADALNLVLKSNTEDFSWVRPTVEAGYEHSFSSGAKARLYGRLGLQHYLSDDSTEVQAGLKGVDVDVAPLTSQVELGQDGLQSVVGVDILFANEMTLQFQYRYETADNFQLDAGLIKFSMPF